MTIEDIKDKELLLFECLSGSKAYGLDTPESDTDLKGVFYLPKDQFYGLDYIPQISNESNDEVYYEIGRFVELLVKNNPNILEVLASPKDCVIYKHPLMNKLSIDLFLSKLCKDTFAGYALTQIRKAQGYKKKIMSPMDKNRKTIFDFCYIIDGSRSISVKEWLDEHDYKQENCGLSSVPHAKDMYALYYDTQNKYGYHGIAVKETANQVSLSSIPKEQEMEAYLFCNAEAYSTYCKEYKGYWDWVAKRNDIRYNTNLNHGKNYDSKNMMHTIRLLQTVEEILRDGRLNIRTQNRKQLLNIKSGAMDYHDLLKMAESIIKSIESYYLISSLPNIPDKERAEKILIKIRNELYN